MAEIPLGVSGATTIALIVVLGVFGFPWLLARPGGPALATIATAFLAGLFVAFEASSGRATAASLAVAGALAVGPLAAALIVRRLQRKSRS